MLAPPSVALHYSFLEENNSSAPPPWAKSFPDFYTPCSWSCPRQKGGHLSVEKVREKPHRKYKKDEKGQQGNKRFRWSLRVWDWRKMDGTNRDGKKRASWVVSDLDLAMLAWNMDICCKHVCMWPAMHSAVQAHNQQKGYMFFFNKQKEIFRWHFP